MKFIIIFFSAPSPHLPPPLAYGVIVLPTLYCAAPYCTVLYNMSFDCAWCAMDYSSGMFHRHNSLLCTPSLRRLMKDRPRAHSERHGRCGGQPLVRRNLGCLASRPLRAVGEHSWAAAAAAAAAARKQRRYRTSMDFWSDSLASGANLSLPTHPSYQPVTYCHSPRTSSHLGLCISFTHTTRGSLPPCVADFR